MHYKYILLNSDGDFRRVYPVTKEDKLKLIGAQKFVVSSNSSIGHGANNGTLIFISDEHGINKGLEYNEIASKLAGYELYGDILIEDRDNRWHRIG
jgi:hypothetical protein